MAPPCVLLLLKNRDATTEKLSQFLQSTTCVLWIEVPLNILTSYISILTLSPAIALPENSSAVLEYIVRLDLFYRFISPPVVEWQCKN